MSSAPFTCDRCAVKEGWPTKGDGGLPSFLTFFLSLLSPFRASTSMQGMPADFAAST